MTTHEEFTAAKRTFNAEADALWAEHGMVRPTFRHADTPMIGGWRGNVVIRRKGGDVSAKHVYLNGTDLGPAPHAPVTDGGLFADSMAREVATLAMVLEAEDAAAIEHEYAETY